MWVNSKIAAEILEVEFNSVQQAVYRAKKAGKKFCTIKHKILCFKHTSGRGGVSGKILQIWLDDTLIKQRKNDKTATAVRGNFNSTTDFSTAGAGFNTNDDFNATAGIINTFENFSDKGLAVRSTVDFDLVTDFYTNFSVKRKTQNKQHKMVYSFQKSFCIFLLSLHRNYFLLNINYRRDL